MVAVPARRSSAVAAHELDAVEFEHTARCDERNFALRMPLSVLVDRRSLGHTRVFEKEMPEDEMSSNTVSTKKFSPEAVSGRVGFVSSRFC